MRDAVDEAGMANEEFGWEELPGEGAFYAPKLEWHLTDAIGRTWQVGTIQGDRVLPERLDATYIGEDGEKHRPVMLHRAIFGSYERFIGILIEHFAGRLPCWLAPMQAVVATIVSDADDYAKEVAAKLEAAGIRVSSDLRNEKINYKVREHSLAKVPHLLVVGNREAEEGTVAIRTLGQKDQRVMSVDEAVTMLRDRQCRRICGVNRAMRKRWWLALAGLAVLGLGMLTLGYSNARADPIVREAYVPVADWPVDEPPLRVLSIADVQVAGPDMPPERVRRIARQMNRLSPDLIVVPGDLISEKRAATRHYTEAETAAPFADFEARLGMVVVPGNHDHWVDFGILGRSARKSWHHRAAKRGSAPRPGADRRDRRRIHRP